ncbi:MAG: FAD-dependent thymidylate synthase [Candidatus Hodarchaeales archaeon]
MKDEEIRVELVACVPESDYHATIAAMNCYSPVNDLKQLKSMAVNRTSLLEKVVASGHLSIIEFAYFIFYITGIDRATSHQLVRHRIASYAQQSQRYVNAENFDYRVPESVKQLEDIKLKTKAIDQIHDAFGIYKELIEAGVPREDARFILPNATTTCIVMGMNARALLNFFDRRCCYRAQKPIRELANKMLAICKKEAPVIFSRSGPYCKRHGYCPEENKCSEMKNIPKLEDLLKQYKREKSKSDKVLND